MFRSWVLCHNYGSCLLETRGRRTSASVRRAWRLSRNRIGQAGSAPRCNGWPCSCGPDSRLRRQSRTPPASTTPAATQLISELAGHGITATGTTGLNVWVRVADEATNTAALYQQGWAVAPGSRFRQASPPGIRITVSALDQDSIPGSARPSPKP